MVRRGRRRVKGEVQRNTPSQNAFGESEPSWAKLADRWIQIERLDGSELVRSDVEYDEQPALLRFDWGSDLSDLKPADRVVAGGATYDLESVRNVNQRNREFECLGVARG